MQWQMLPDCVHRNSTANGNAEAPCVANGANEMAVELFLKGKISFLQIGEFVQKATDECVNKQSFTVEDVFEADRLAREAVLSYIK